MKGKTSILIATLLMFMLTSTVLAASEDYSEGSATVTSAVPTLSSIELWNQAEDTNVNATALVVNTEYHLNFTVSDANSMADLKNITIRVWNTDYTTENGSNTERNHYSYTWVESTDTWTSYPSGFINAAACADPGTGGGGSSYEFRLAFDTSKVANYTATNTKWQASIFVWDDSDNADNDKTVKFGVASYFEISITDTTHSWSSLTPNTNDNALDGDGDIDFTVIANTFWKAQAKSNASVLISELSDTINIGNITIHKDTLGSSVSLTTSYADVGGLTSQNPPTAEASPVSTLCTLWLDVPNGTPPGTYEYKLYLQVVIQS